MGGAHGQSICAVAINTTAAPVSAANPWTGSSLAIRIPSVRMIFQPPNAVPNPMDKAQETTPIAFCASLAPRLRAINPADSN